LLDTAIEERGAARSAAAATGANARGRAEEGSRPGAMSRGASRGPRVRGPGRSAGADAAAWRQSALVGISLALPGSGSAPVGARVKKRLHVGAAAA